MKLRIVTPTLGQSRWLPETRTSVEELGQPVEHLLVAPAARCPALTRAGIGQTVLPQAGDGLYAALNTGFRADGDWTWGTWINDDDRLVADGVDAAVALLDTRPELAAVYGRVRLIDAAGRELAEIPVAREGDDLGPLLAAGLVPLAQPGTVFRRKVFAQLGGFDEALRAAGDLDFFRRALVAGFRFGFIDERVAEFRVHGGQISQQAETRHRETAALVAAARARPDWAQRARGARWRFRWGNLGVYAARVRRQGLVSMERLSART